MITDPTLADLEAAPTGSRLVRNFGYGSKTILHKRKDGRWVFGQSALHFPGHDVPAYALVFNRGALGGDDAVLHHPAPVRVTLRELGSRWDCRACGMWARFYFYNPHDEARAHAALHAEVTVA